MTLSSIINPTLNQKIGELWSTSTRDCMPMHG